MMKKVLLMLAILAVVSNAAILEVGVGGAVVEEIDMDPSDEITLQVICTGDPSNDQFWLGIGGSGQGEFLDNGTPYNPPGPEGVTVDDYGYGSAWRYYRITSPGTYLPETGVWYEVTFHCTGPDDVIIELYEEDGVTIRDTMIIHQPEPMTIALLGLGGLFLRRRK